MAACVVALALAGPAAAQGQGQGPPAATADGFHYDLSVGIGHSDNIERTNTDPIAETILGVGAAFDYAHHSSRWDAVLNGDLNWFDYLENTYDAEVLGNMAGTAVYAFVPERFTWAFEENFGQAQMNPFQPVTPGNSENINLFSTGPNVTFGLGSRYQLQLFGRWSDVYYQTSPFDGQRWLGGGSFQRSLSPQSTISLSGTYANMQYSQQPSSSDFVVQEYYAGYTTEGARIKALVNLGYRTLDQGGSTTSGPLFRLDLSRHMSAYSTLRLRAGSDFGDTGQLLKQWQSGVPTNGGQGSIVATQDVAQQRYVEGSWDLSRQRTDLTFVAGYHDNTYQDNDTIDQNWVTLGGRATRHLRESLNVGGGVLWRDYTFPNQAGQDYNQLQMNAFVQWKPARAFYTTVEVQYFTDSADDPARGFNETRVWLWLGYAPGQQGFPQTNFGG